MTIWLIQQAKAEEGGAIVYYGEDAVLRTDDQELESFVSRFAGKHGYREQDRARFEACVISDEVTGEGCIVTVMPIEV